MFFPLACNPSLRFGNKQVDIRKQTSGQSRIKLVSKYTKVDDAHITANYTHSETFIELVSSRYISVSMQPLKFKLANI